MLDQRPIWQRLALLVFVALMGLVILLSLTLFSLHGIEDRAIALAQQGNSIRMSQRIIVRALEIRSQAMLALQHNPTNGVISNLHDHAVDIHFKAAQQAQKELLEALTILRENYANGDAERAEVVGKVERSIRQYVESGVTPMLQQLSEQHYGEANVILLKQTNPAYSLLKQNASALADHVQKTVQAENRKMSEQIDGITVSVIVAGLALLLICGFVGWKVAHSITRQIGGEPQDGMDLMGAAAAGNLSVKLDAPHGSMLESLALMLGSLGQMIRDIRGSASELKAHSTNINQSVSTISAAAEIQADATSSVAAAIEQLTVSINHIADSVHETEGQAAQSTQHAEQGEAQVQHVARIMSAISSQLTEASSQIGSLDTRAHQISSIAAVIKDIANQTNLLALNAAIEAARAGETGRGFAVVADEVRKLAERTSSATGDIEKMIADIQVETSRAVTMMQATVPEVEQGSARVQEAQLALDSIRTSSAVIGQQVRDISAATREQGGAADAIALRIEQIAQSAEESSYAVRNVARTAEAVEKQAAQLEVETARFTV